MKIKEEHKDLKKKVNIAEKKRNTKRGTKSWHDLRTLKKLKLNMKDKLSKSKQGRSVARCREPKKLTYCPIKYGKTSTQLVPREIN